MDRIPPDAGKVFFKYQFDGNFWSAWKFLLFLGHSVFVE
jgi:hypothetical protein